MNMGFRITAPAAMATKVDTALHTRAAPHFFRRPPFFFPCRDHGSILLCARW
jgi:hypothetical protein